MSDTRLILQLPGAELESIEQDGDDITLKFSQAYIVQEMEGAFEDSLWTQAVELIIRGMKLTGDLPQCPCVIGGGDLINNIFTYRDHAPLPIKWHGDVSCTFTIAANNESFTLKGASIQLKHTANPRYIKHISKDHKITGE
ncbi:MAG: hypothetical protein R3308_04580 [Thiohalobacterales bacterium]|nr:hypothetical protein [Thiohalobacterales bacterium]